MQIGPLFTPKVAAQNHGSSVSGPPQKSSKNLRYNSDLCGRKIKSPSPIWSVSTRLNDTRTSPIHHAPARGDRVHVHLLLVARVDVTPWYPLASIGRMGLRGQWVTDTTWAGEPRTIGTTHWALTRPGWRSWSEWVSFWLFVCSNIIHEFSLKW